MDKTTVNSLKPNKNLIWQFLSLGACLNEEEMRDALALIKEFKSPENCCDVVEITLKNSVPARSGIAGPQTEFGKVYPGGAKQYELLMNTKDTELVKKTFEIERLYRL